VGKLTSNFQHAHQDKEEQCFICESLKTKGIHLNNCFICTDCERDMINTKTNELKYHFYIHRLRKAQISQKNRLQA
jgi:recombinational DNA repair protein RecR